MRISIIIIFLLINMAGKCQNKEEIILLIKNVHSVKKPIIFEDAYNNNNAIESSFSILFLFYKHFISSQDNASCSFQPSCSVYAIQSIKSLGLFSGTLNFIDRLTRCNSLSPEYYIINQKDHLLIDPVRNIKYDKPD